FLCRYGKPSAGLEPASDGSEKCRDFFGSSTTNLCGDASPIGSYPRENGLFPVRPRVALLLVLLPAQSLDAKALRTLVANGHFRWLATHIANVACVFWPWVGLLAGNYFHVCLPLYRG